MVGSRAEKHHSSSVGKNCVMMGFCNEEEKRPRVTRDVAALVPVTGAAFADAESPAATAPWPGLAPLLEAGNTWQGASPFLGDTSLALRLKGPEAR